MGKDRRVGSGVAMTRETVVPNWRRVGPKDKNAKGVKRDDASGGAAMIGAKPDRGASIDSAQKSKGPQKEAWRFKALDVAIGICRIFARVGRGWNLLDMVRNV